MMRESLMVAGVAVITGCNVPESLVSTSMYLQAGNSYSHCLA